MRIVATLTLAALAYFTTLAMGQRNAASEVPQGSQGSVHHQGQAGGKSRSLEQQITALDDQSREAALKNDVSFLEKHLADDFVFVDGSGQQLTKNEVIQNRKDANTKYESIDLKERKIRLYGNTAIVDHDAMVKGRVNGQPMSGESRMTSVWVKQGNNWKLVSMDVIPVQAAAAASKQ